MSTPWMPLYVADYLADTRRLSTLEHGVYMLLIMDYWRNGGLPDDERRLARIAGLSEDEWADVRDNIAELFSDGWRHKRVDQELAKSAEKSDAARNSATKRWHKGQNADAMRSHSDGNAEDMPAQCEGNANAMLSQPQPSSSLRSEEQSSLRSDSSSPVGDDGEPLEKTLRVKRQKPDDEDLIQDIAALWNDGAASMGLTQIRDLPPRRLAAVRGRLKDFSTYGFDDPINGFHALIAKIRGSPFLMGQTGPWKADFDFVMSSKGFTKIMEGTYESQGRKNGYAPGRH